MAYQYVCRCKCLKGIAWAMCGQQLISVKDWKVSIRLDKSLNWIDFLVTKPTKPVYPCQFIIFNRLPSKQWAQPFSVTIPCVENAHFHLILKIQANITFLKSFNNSKRKLLTEWWQMKDPRINSYEICYKTTNSRNFEFYIKTASSQLYVQLSVPKQMPHE